MSESQIILNTWKCDGLGCPTPAEITENNPYNHLTLTSHIGTGVEFDLCPVCIPTITAQLVVDFIAALPPL